MPPTNPHGSGPSLREQIDAFARNGGGDRRFFRPTFNDADRARLAKHAPHFTALAESGAVAEYKQAHTAMLIDLERLNNALVSSKNGLSPEGEDVRDTLSELRHLYAQNAELQATLDREARDSRTATGGGSARTRGASETWRDENGAPVPVYTPKDSLSAGQHYDGPSFGDIVRAAATGHRLREVQNALSTGTVAAGGALVPTELAAEVIDRLRARSVAIRAGARTVNLPTKTMQIAKITGDPTLSWAAEAASIADTGPTFAQVTMTAKTLRGWVKVSRELLEDAVNLDEALRTVFANAMAVELDRAALVGSGTGQEPLGIGAAVGAAPVTSMGVNGAQLANWDSVIDLLAALQTANANDPTAMVMAPRTATTIAKFKEATTNAPLAVPSALSAIPRLITTSIPVNQSQGSSNAASSVIMGDFTDLILGIRSELQIVRTDGAFMQTNEIGLLFVMRADVAWARAESFAQLRGIIP